MSGIGCAERHRVLQLAWSFTTATGIFLEWSEYVRLVSNTKEPS